ncbi:hypothetical protein JBKA6_1375 [Ichthyobacterium seriolicida]|uniref:Uncharacterized protein n=1 Tax=Ichthyobacterium seriolicida TaxID=242600 RepID=A0A1J1E5Q4_9FLAO|nr:hypothetical protein JBKA6_1375 [Ichthyobacterium seriolicida]
MILLIELRFVDSKIITSNKKYTVEKIISKWIITIILAKGFRFLSIDDQVT